MHEDYIGEAHMMLAEEARWLHGARWPGAATRPVHGTRRQLQKRTRRDLAKHLAGEALQSQPAANQARAASWRALSGLRGVAQELSRLRAAERAHIAGEPVPAPQIARLARFGSFAAWRADVLRFARAQILNSTSLRQRHAFVLP